MRKAVLVSAAFAAATALAPMGAAAQAKKEEAKSPWTMTGNIGFVSEYRYRGINQTNGKPAIQGGFDWAHEQGFYVGTWASNVSWLSDLGASNSLEWDFYGGYKGKAANLSYDVGALYYWYPGTYPSTFTRPNTFEIYGAVTWEQFTLKYSHGLSNIFGYTDSKGSGYLDLTGTFELPGGFNLVAHLGHQMIPASTPNNRVRSDCSYSDWKLGVTTEAVGFTFGLSYIDTNAKGGAGQCYANPYNKDLGKGVVVLSATKNF